MAMNMQLMINDRQIEINIKKKAIKNLYLRFNSDLELVVTCPFLTSEKEIYQLINNNQQKIIKLYENMLSNYEKEDVFYFLGEKYPIVFQNNIKKPSFDQKKLYVRDLKMLNKYYLQETKRIFDSRFNVFVNLIAYSKPISLRIRKMKTRWGVCNKTARIITLNSELIKKEMTLIDYVIVHELCHLMHPNHSADYWLEVAKYYPYYKKARKLLKGI